MRRVPGSLSWAQMSALSDHDAACAASPSTSSTGVDVRTSIHAVGSVRGGTTTELM